MMNNLANIATPLHQFCISMAPKSNYQEFYSAIVCGSNLNPSFFKENLKNSGLLHLIVVSGSHLIFLGVIIDKVFGSTNRGKLKLTIIFFYSLITLAQPPVIRAFTAVCLGQLRDFYKLHWNSYQSTWLTFCVTISIFPHWVESYSFLLSSCAALALCITSHSKGLRKHLLIYIILFPVLLPVCPPHPLSILLNLLIAPFLGFILFPLSLIGFILPISMFTDKLWLGVDFLLQKIAIPPNTAPIPLSKNILWGYILLLNLFFIVQYTVLRRRNAFHKKT